MTRTEWEAQVRVVWEGVRIIGMKIKGRAARHRDWNKEFTEKRVPERPWLTG